MAAQAFQFWFQVISMKPSEAFQQRAVDGEWRPPRPQASNILTGDGSEQVWYTYNDGVTTTPAEEPDSNTATHFKTYSLYVDGDRFWIYPCNAIRYRVGDGSIHRPPSSDSGTEGFGDGSSDLSSKEDDNSEEDWRLLSFQWEFLAANPATSCAMLRGLHDVLQVQREDQAWVREVLPDRYHASWEQRTSPGGTGGLVGKLPILIALIALSVIPGSVSWALMHCLQQSYNCHRQPRGQGWTPRRGVVVRVFRQVDSEQHGQLPEENPAYRRMRSFEYGRSGLGNFFP